MLKIRMHVQTQEDVDNILKTLKRDYIILSTSKLYPDKYDVWSRVYIEVEHK